jgi:acyl-CoA thioester hydrolase
MFTYHRRPHFYETDAMGIIHHASYLRWFEEARVEFLRESGVLQQLGLDVVNYPLLKVEIDYKKSIVFEDEVMILLTGKIDGIRLCFEYEIQTKRFTECAAFGKTIHVAMDMTTKKPMRIPSQLIQLLDR